MRRLRVSWIASRLLKASRSRGLNRPLVATVVVGLLVLSAAAFPHADAAGVPDLSQRAPTAAVVGPVVQGPGVIGVLGLAPCPPDEDNQNLPRPSAPPTPAAPAGSLAAPSLALAPASDTGRSNSDRLTGNNMPTVQGQAPAGSQVTVFDGRALIGAATADGQGRWSYMLNECQALNDGAHTISAQAQDAQGQVSPLSAGLTVTILTKAPAMPVIDAPAPNSHAQAGRVTISGTAAPNLTIQVLDGSKPQASTHADARGAWSLTLTGLTAGPHTFRAQALDAAGNASPAFNAHPITVDTAP